jgi:predicted GNAT family acetyltransferase
MVSDQRVIQNESAQRFEIENAGGVAMLTYHLGNHHITLVHTEVAPELEGKGYAGMLVRAALEFARARTLRVIPLCPFVRAYIARHPEYADLVDAVAGG